MRTLSYQSNGESAKLLFLHQHSTVSTPRKSTNPSIEKSQDDNLGSVVLLGAKRTRWKPNDAHNNTIKGDSRRRGIFSVFPCSQGTWMCDRIITSLFFCEAGNNLISKNNLVESNTVYKQSCSLSWFISIAWIEIHLLWPNQNFYQCSYQ